MPSFPACPPDLTCRLTGENFDLREKIKNLNDTVKRLKKQLKLYMKKISDSGGNLTFFTEDSLFTNKFFFLHHVLQCSCPLRLIRTLSVCVNVTFSC